MTMKEEQDNSHDTVDGVSGSSSKEEGEMIGEDEEDQKPLLSDEQDAPLFDVVNEWAQGTSIHGVASVTDRDTYTWWKRLLWFVLMIGCCLIMVWQISTLLMEYNDYEVITDTQTIVPLSMDFPEVTVCNFNKFMAPVKESLGISEPRNMSELLQISHGFQDFITLTFFNQKEVEDLSGAWKEVITAHGRCYSFQTDKRVYVPGEEGGLLFHALLMQDLYDEWQDVAGLKVFVQQPGTPISSQIPFEIVGPGKWGVLGLDKTAFHRERKAPWARCKGDAPAYSHARCLDECASEAIRWACGCKRFHDPLEPDMRFCTNEDWSQEGSECFELVEAGHENNYALCPCDLPPCSEETYRVTTKTAEYSIKFLETFREKFGEDADPAWFAKNYVMVHINYNAIQYEQLTEAKAVTRAQLLGSIGGSMGLFLGISVLSIVELFGDLGMLRLFPRLFGVRNLHGFGSRVDA